MFVGRSVPLSLPCPLRCPRPAFTRRTRGHSLGTLTTVNVVSVITARAAAYLSVASVERGIVEIDMCAGCVMTSLLWVGVSQETAFMRVR